MSAPPRRIVLRLLASAGVVLAGCGSSGEKTVVRTVTAPATAATSAPATAAVAPAPTASAVTVRLGTFRTPSGNIGCSLIAGIARCDIRAHDWRPPRKPASCQFDWGPAVSVEGAGRGRFRCISDTAYDPSAPVLAYGRDSRVGAFLCASRTQGITCRNVRTGHGFFLARNRYRMF